MQILLLYRLDFLLCVSVIPGVIVEEKRTSARIRIQMRIFSAPCPGWTCINFHCHFACLCYEEA